MKRNRSAASQSMLGGAMFLTIAMALVKVIGLVFKLPLTSIIDADGRYFFSAAYELYLPIYAIAITGLPIAVSRMVSQRCTLGLYNDVREIHAIARRLFLLTGATGSLLMLAIAYPFARFVAAGQLNTLPAILSIAPAIFFCCAMSAYRGYYEGMRNMVPTAVSQVIEAACKMLVGLLLAFLVMKTGLAEYHASGTVFGTPAASETAALHLLYPWGAAAAILGITAGSVLGLLFLWLRHTLKGDGITREMLCAAPPPQPRKALLREMIKIAIPMVISSTILNITNVIDTFNLNHLIEKTVEKFPDIIEGIYGSSFLVRGSETVAQRSTYIIGVYNTALDFRTLIPTIVTALGVSALPVISAAYTARKKEAIQSTINTVLRMALMLALPAGFGMAVLSREIMTLFYEKSSQGITEHGAPILMLFGIFTALMAVSAPIISMLQGIGRTDIPVKSLIAGTALKIGANYLLVSRPEINVKGAVYGTVLFYAVIVSINLFMLLRVTKTKLQVMSVLVKPLFCALLSTAAAWLARDLSLRFLSRIIGSERLVLFGTILAAVACAVLVYAVSMLLTRAITQSDLESFPGGKKIGKVLAKRGLLG